MDITCDSTHGWSGFCDYMSRYAKLWLVTFSGRKTLDAVSLAVHTGQVVAVLRNNGSGKSTPVKILAGVYQTDTGAIVEVRDADGSFVVGPRPGTSCTSFTRISVWPTS